MELYRAKGVFSVESLDCMTPLVSVAFVAGFMLPPLGFPTRGPADSYNWLAGKVSRKRCPSFLGFRGVTQSKP
jgi:hypothetical protein